MTIIFKTRDGRTVETTDKNVLIAAAKNGEIGPDTVVTIDGAGINAGRIKELVFGDPPPAAPVNPPKPEPAPSSKPEPTCPGKLPKEVASAFSGLSGLSGLAYISGGISLIAGVPAIGLGLESGNIVSIVTGAIVSVGGMAQIIAVNWTLTILEYIAKK